MPRILALICLLLGVLVQPAFAHDDKLAGADWVLDGATGKRAPFLHFDGGRVGGFAGCNRFGGQYEQTGGGLSFSPLAATRMACMDGMDTEQQFLDMLGKVKGMKLEGDKLELLDAQGKVLASFTRRVAE